MERTEVRAALAQMIELAAKAWAIGDDVARKLAPHGDDALYEILFKIQECSLTDIDEVMEEIDSLVMSWQCDGQRKEVE